MIPILSQTQEQFCQNIFSKLGKGKRHAALLYAHWMRTGKADPERWAENQALKLVGEMIAATDFSLPPIVKTVESDKTVKFLLKVQNGLETESVAIPMESGTTLCISSQVGCKMGCAFCETGRMGLLKNLTAEEIVSQVFVAKFQLGIAVKNIVFMGMGEPLDNYDAVMQAVKILTDPNGFGLGHSRITISTSGVVPRIYQLIEEAPPALNLAVSVNASNDLIRNKIMPVNRKWDMQALKEAMKAYSAHPRRQIFAEYVLLKDVNDSLECADALASYLSGLSVKINLIPYNPQSKDRFAPPEIETQELFMQRLRAQGHQVLLRHHKGRSIMAACGQLGNLNLSKSYRSSNITPLEEKHYGRQN
jgi:23S rRNA (adenine2503-C2)-methyltransferase